MHYAKAPAIDTTYRINGGVTFASLRKARSDRRMKAIERYIEKQTVEKEMEEQIIQTAKDQPITYWQRIKNLFN